jgi:hypothetical protein
VTRSSAGVVCPPTAEDFADALRRLLVHGDDRLARTPAGQDAWLSDHSWDAAADRVAKVLGL